MQMQRGAGVLDGLSGLLFTLAIVLCSAPWWHAAAGTGEAFILPQPGTKATSGLQILVEPQWVAGAGYRPVTLTVTCPAPAKADRTLRVELFPNSYNRMYQDLRTAAYVEIPEGSQQAKETVYVPQRDRWHNLRVEVYEDGVHREDLSMERGYDWRDTGRGYQSEACPTVLFVDSGAPSLSDRKKTISATRVSRQGGETFDLPDPSRLSFLFPDYNQQLAQELDEIAAEQRGTDNETLEWIQNVPKTELLPPSDLPDNPLGLSAIDVVFIPLEDLAVLAADHPERMSSLTRHIQSGASLIVYGCGDQFARLPQVERLLGMEPNDSSSGDSAWETANPSNYGKKVSTYEAFVQSYGQWRGGQWRPPGVTVADDAVTQPVAVEKPTPVEQRANVKLRDYGLGKVVVIDAHDPFRQETLFWHWVFRNLGMNRWLWQKRHGMSLQSNNEGFWEFMIPGVGAAPVKSFLATIVLFVIAIGPVNYFLLKRIKRLYLLPLTVPLAAGATTAVIILYALVSDGLSTRMRLRSFTYINQPKDMTVSWSRQTYYAALTPSGGITFPSDSCVYPLDPFPSDSQTRVRRFDVQDDDSQERILSQGYLSSRATAQFMVVRTQPKATGISVLENPLGEFQVINRLGSPLEQLWVTDSQGTLFTAESLAEGARVQPRPADPSAERKRIGELLSANRTQLPAGFDTNMQNNFFGRLGRTFSLPGVGPPSSATSRLEMNLQQARNFLPPQPKTYLAVTREAPAAVPIGIEAREEASFHVVRGHW